jgi:hypothetical protein
MMMSTVGLIRAPAEYLREGGLPMKRTVLIPLLLITLIGTFAAGHLHPAGTRVAALEQEAPPEAQAAPTRLGVVWTSGDRDVALKMVFMYVYNAKRGRWFDEVKLIVWGPSAKLLSEDTELQEWIARMSEVGVVVEACKACSDMYDVSETLTGLGVDVKYMGRVLTDMLQGDWEVMTY